MPDKDYVEFKLYRDDIRNAYPDRKISDRKCDELLKALQEIHETDGVINEHVIRECLGAFDEMP
ncbi:MAG: hypothetical protein EPN97_16825 [Alphaproteobacteria bacterium]|nr:MAG: hypothetical protein EPN97_16825 [Alphaproteobacteria bacterium]